MTARTEFLRELWRVRVPFWHRAAAVGGEEQIIAPFNWPVRLEEGLVLLEPCVRAWFSVRDGRLLWVGYQGAQLFPVPGRGGEDVRWVLGLVALAVTGQQGRAAAKSGQAAGTLVGMDNPRLWVNPGGFV